MSTPLPTHLAAPIIALTILVTAIALMALVARAAHRGTRSGRREKAAGLFQLLAGRMAGRVPSSALRNAVRRAESESFWAAIEAIVTTLRHRERMELSRSLERSRHTRIERRTLREDDVLERRELAARRLGLLPSRRSRATLRRALITGPESVRFAAARSLARHRDLAALGWLLEHPDMLAARPIPALSGLLRAFGPGARALLITALEHEQTPPRFECALLDALGVSRCQSARPAIALRLKSGHPEVRIAAARALGRLGLAESVPALLAALGDEAWPVRAQAANALGRLHSAESVEALVALVSDRSWWVRHHAAYALAVIGADGRDALCSLVVRSADPYAREMAREALDHAVKRRSA